MPSKIVFLGDSLTEYCPWEKFFPDVEAMNMGVSGDTTDGVRERIPWVVRANPEKIFLMVGINDLFMKKDKRRIVENYREILGVLRSQLPETKIFVQSILPTDDIWMNADIEKINGDIRSLADGLGAEYIDIYQDFVGGGKTVRPDYVNDGVHLSQLGYVAWKNAIEKYCRGC